MSYLSALQKCFPSPEYAVMFEVPDCTGFAGSRRMDVVVMGLWPSRGLELQGIEVKRYRSDWLRERKNPEKQELHARFMDTMWLLTTEPGVAELDEVPEQWGWMHFNGQKLVTKKKAPTRSPEPPSRGFLAALLKAFMTPNEQVVAKLVESRTKERSEQMDNTIKKLKEQNRFIQADANDRERRAYATIKAHVAAIENALGFAIFPPMSMDDALRLRELATLQKNIRAAADALQALQGACAGARRGLELLESARDTLKGAGLQEVLREDPPTV